MRHGTLPELKLGLTSDTRGGCGDAGGPKGRRRCRLVVARAASATGGRRCVVASPVAEGGSSGGRRGGWDARERLLLGSIGQGCTRVCGRRGLLLLRGEQPEVVEEAEGEAGTGRGVLAAVCAYVEGGEGVVVGRRGGEGVVLGAVDGEEVVEHRPAEYALKVGRREC